MKLEANNEKTRVASLAVIKHLINSSGMFTVILEQRYDGKVPPEEALTVVIFVWLIS